jgi:hypothetical protein
MNAPANTFLEYQISSIEAGFFLTTSGFAGSTFSDQVSSGSLFDVAVTAFDTTTTLPVNAVILRDQTVASGQTLMGDFDFAGANACPFDNSVTVTYSGAPLLPESFATFFSIGAGELEFRVSDGLGLPATVNLPDLSSSKLTGSQQLLEFGLEDPQANFAETSCALPLGAATPAGVMADFLGLPTNVSPADGSNPATFGQGDMVSFTLGAGNGISSGVNTLALFSTFQEGNESIFALWQVFLAPNVTSFEIPQLFPAKPMFGEGFASASASATRFDFPNFNYATLFDENFPSNIAVLDTTTTCDAQASSQFTIGTPPLAARSGDLPKRHLLLPRGGPQQ